VNQDVDSGNVRRARRLTRQPSINKIGALALCSLRLLSPGESQATSIEGAAATKDGVTNSLGSQTEIKASRLHGLVWSRSLLKLLKVIFQLLWNLRTSSRTGEDALGFRPLQTLGWPPGAFARANSDRP